MLQTPIKLIFFRLFNITLGRINYLSLLLKRVLIFLIIKKKDSKNFYVATSDFFSVKNLETSKKKDEFYFIGKANDESIRERGSSGGIVRALLVDLFERKIIGGALLTYLDGLDPSQKIAKTTKEILNSAKSIYQKFDNTSAFELLAKTNIENLAVVGLPCQISAYRRVPEINNKIKIYLGLYCGGSLKKEAVSVLLKKLRINKKDLRSISYRGGKGYGGFEAILKNGKRKFVSKDACNYLNVAYMHEGCKNCQDFFCNEADISFGDCWFKKKYTSILVRGEKSLELIKNSKSIGLIEVSSGKYFSQHKHILNLKNNRIDLSRYKNILNALPFLALSILAKIGKIYKRYF